MRYNRFDDGPRLVERFSPLSVVEAWRSALRSEDRRVSNSGLRGHCRAFDGPIASARRRARRAIGGISAPHPAPAPRASSKTRTLRRTAAKVARERHRQSAARAFEWDTAAAGCVTLRKYFWWWNASELEHGIEQIDRQRCVGRRLAEWPAARFPSSRECFRDPQ